MKRFLFTLASLFSLCALFVLAQKMISVPRNLDEGATVYYVSGQSLYHAKDCPEITGQNAYATNVWTMRWRDMKPCPKCLYKEVPAPEKPAVRGLVGGIAGDFRSIAKWEGSAMKSTETFSVSKDEWVVYWTTSGNSNFAITVYNADTNQSVDLIANIVGNGMDYSVVRGKGRYYLKIMSSQPYTIEVLEKK
jgi:hypothetical protein